MSTTETPNAYCVILGTPGTDPLTIVGPFATNDEAAAHVTEHKEKNPQEDARDRVQPKDMDRWMHGGDRREGDNYVYVYQGRYGDQEPPEGKHAYSDDGRRYEVVVAPDGRVLERVEFTVEPVEDRW